MTDDGSDAKTIAKQGSIAFLGNIVNKLLGFVFLAVVTRLVSPSVFGVYSLGLSIILFTKGFSNLNLHRSIDYFVPQYIKDEEYGKARSVLINVVIIGVVSTTVAGLLVILGRELLADAFSEPLLVDILPLLCIVLPLSAVFSALNVSFNSVKKLKYSVYTQRISLPLSKLILAVILIYAGFDLLGLVGAYVLSFLLATIVGLILLYRNVSWVTGQQRRSVSNRDIVSYSLPLVFVGVIYATVGQVDYFVIGYFSESENVGIYRVAHVLSSNLLIFITSITPIFKPMVAEIRHDTAALRSRYQLSTRWIVMTTLPAAITLAIAPQEYLTVFFTGEYALASGVVVVLVLGFVINALAGPEGMFLEGVGYTRLTLFNTAFLIATNSVLDVILVPRIGILGAAIGTAGAYSVTVLLGIGEIYYFKDVHPFTRDLGKTLASGVPAVLAGILVSAITSNSILIAVLLPVIVLSTYLTLLKLLNGFTSEDSIVAKEVDERIGYRVLGRFIPHE